MSNPNPRIVLTKDEIQALVSMLAYTSMGEAENTIQMDGYTKAQASLMVGDLMMAIAKLKKELNGLAR